MHQCITIRGCQDIQTIDAISDYFRKEGGRERGLLLGVPASIRTDWMALEEVRVERTSVPSLQEMVKTFRRDTARLNMLEHDRWLEKPVTIEIAHQMLQRGGESIDVLFLNAPWPDPSVIEFCKTMRPLMEVVLPVVAVPAAVGECKPQAMVKRLIEYKNAVNTLVIFGEFHNKRGLEYTRRYINAVYGALPPELNLGFMLCGEFTHQNVKDIAPIIETYPDQVSIHSTFEVSAGRGDNRLEEEDYRRAMRDKFLTHAMNYLKATIDLFPVRS